MNKMLQHTITGLLGLTICASSSTAAINQGPDQAGNEHNDSPISYLYQTRSDEQPADEIDTSHLPGVDTEAAMQQLLSEIEPPDVNLNPSHASNEDPAVLIYQVKPHYPAKAQLAGTEGWVELVLSVNELGQVADVDVVQSKPARVFDQAAVNSVYQWKFKPKTVAGKQVAFEYRQTIKFELINYINVDGKYVAEQ
jgi:TonB family protein